MYGGYTGRRTDIIQRLEDLAKWNSRTGTKVSSQLHLSATEKIVTYGRAGGKYKNSSPMKETPWQMAMPQKFHSQVPN